MQADDRYASPDTIDDTVAFDETAEQSGWRSHRIRLIILAGVIGLAVAYMVYAAFPGNALFFATVNEFVEDPYFRTGAPCAWQERSSPILSGAKTVQPCLVLR